MDPKLIELCHKKLLAAKAELLNQFQSYFHDLQGRANGGDEGDQTANILVENQLFALQKRLRSQLAEIEAALSRIENGTFGLCEVTQEPIEENRLLAIPWTRFSIEGAEIREQQSIRRA